MVTLAESTNARTIHFDQCMTRDDPATTPEKKTVLMFSDSMFEVVHEQFAHLMCNHAPGTHPSMLGLGADGTPVSSKLSG